MLLTRAFRLDIGDIFQFAEIKNGGMYKVIDKTSRLDGLYCIAIKSQEEKEAIPFSHVYYVDGAELIEKQEKEID
jgi:hypothetical protein